MDMLRTELGLFVLPLSRHSFPQSVTRGTVVRCCLQEWEGRNCLNAWTARWGTGTNCVANASVKPSDGGNNRLQCSAGVGHRAGRYLGSVTSGTNPASHVIAISDFTICFPSAASLSN